MSLPIYRTQLNVIAKGLVFPKLNQLLTNHFTPVLNAHFFMPDITLEVNVAENNRILRDAPIPVQKSHGIIFNFVDKSC